MDERTREHERGTDGEDMREMDGWRRRHKGKGLMEERTWGRGTDGGKDNWGRQSPPSKHR